MNETMMNSVLPALIAFDLDDTLAPSKSPVEPAMVHALARLLEVAEVCIISGGAYPQFRTQVLGPLADDAGGATRLDRLHLMPTCGTQYYRHDGTTWAREYAEALTDDEAGRAAAVLERRAKALGLWAEETWGPIIEHRESQVTFSALGQSAPVHVKAIWDPDGSKKARLRDAVAADLPDLEVRSGGSTSVDITRRGIDKAYGMRRLAETTGIRFDDMLFIGDRLDEGGNDYPVIALGVRTIAVRGWEHTVEVLEQLLGSIVEGRVAGRSASSAATNGAVPASAMADLGHDPHGIENARQRHPQLEYVADTAEALRDAELVVLVTEWREYRDLDPAATAALVASPVIIDGCNALDAAAWRAAGWRYKGLGRP